MKPRLLRNCVVTWRGVVTRWWKTNPLVEFEGFKYYNFEKQADPDLSVIPIWVRLKTSDPKIHSFPIKTYRIWMNNFHKIKLSLKFEVHMIEGPVISKYMYVCIFIFGRMLNVGWVPVLQHCVTCLGKWLWEHTIRRYRTKKKILIWICLQGPNWHHLDIPSSSQTSPKHFELDCARWNLSIYHTFGIRHQTSTSLKQFWCSGKWLSWRLRAIHLPLPYWRSASHKVVFESFRKLAKTLVRQSIILLYYYDMYINVLC